MTNVTLKDIKDLQIEIDASLATTQAIRDEEIPWKEENSRLQASIRQCKSEIKELSVEEEQNEIAILEVVAKLGIFIAEHEKLTADHWESHADWGRRHNDSWKKDSRLSMKLRKLKRKYWNGHGIFAD